MAKITYICKKCEYKKQIITNPYTKTDFVCPHCNTELEKQLPKITGTDVKETVDTHTNRKYTGDQPTLIKERSENHYWSVEVPRLVQSGVYSIETMLENGWIYLDEKEQMKINTKPPKKR